MGVPMGPRARLEADEGAARPPGRLRAKGAIDPHRACEGVSWTRTGRDGPLALNVHGRAPNGKVNDLSGPARAVQPRPGVTPPPRPPVPAATNPTMPPPWYSPGKPQLSLIGARGRAFIHRVAGLSGLGLA